MNRKFFLLRLALMNGIQRANYLKRIGYFHKQGDNCYFQPYNFGTEPFLIELGSNVSIASGVRFVNHDMPRLFLTTYMEKICLPRWLRLRLAIMCLLAVMLLYCRVFILATM